MFTTPFGQTGLVVSSLGFGGAEIGFLGSEAAGASRVLNLLLDRGVNLIDTAAMYAGSEELVGQAIERGVLPPKVLTSIRQAFAKAEAASGAHWNGQT